MNDNFHKIFYEEKARWQCRQALFSGLRSAVMNRQQVGREITVIYGALIGGYFMAVCDSNDPNQNPVQTGL
jgi:hypothetical protein